MNPFANFLLSWTFQASLVCLALYLIDRVLGRRASASTRHGVHGAGLAAILLLPLATLCVDSRSIEWLPEALPDAVELEREGRARFSSADLDPVASIAPTSVASNTPGPGTRAEAPVSGERAPSSSATPAQRRSDWGLALALLWTLGAAVALTRVGLQARSLSRLAHAAQVADGPLTRRLVRGACASLGVRSAVRVLISAAARVPMTFGLWRPVVVLPEAARGWPETRLRAVLEHELAHVARRDVALQLIAALSAALAWHLPWVHAAKRRLARLRELACDDTVLAVGVSDLSYAQELVAVARGLSTQPRVPSCAVGMGDGGALEERLRSILDPCRVRGPLPLGLRIALVALLIGGAPVLAAARLDPRAGARTSAALLEHLQHPSAAVRASSLLRLAREGDRAHFKAVVAGLADPTPAVRSACVRALTSIGCVPAFVAVTETLEDADPAVRVAAARALECFDHRLEARPLSGVRLGGYAGGAWRELDALLDPSDGRSALERLRSLERDDPDAGVRRAARGTLDELRGD